MTDWETAIVVVALVAHVISVRVLAYRALQGSQRADAILRWASVPMLLGPALIVAIGFPTVGRSEVWSGVGLVVWLCAVQAAIHGKAIGVFLAIVGVSVGTLW